jgi:pyruvate/2-oxoglutarate/acetoin dehydrogenase E1 component
MRLLSYAEAIREAFAQLLARDPRVFVIGQGCWSPWYVGTSMQDLDVVFGRHRVIDSPISENAVTGTAIGAALTGMRPIVIHPRLDFMVLAADQIVNEAANWCYMFGGRAHVPLVIRGIVNRGGQQGAQHSQALHAWFMHVPGIKVVMPATAYDAKGLLISSVLDENPVLYIDDRWLYADTDDVPEDFYAVPMGSAAVRRAGRDVSIVAISYMAKEAARAATSLEADGIAAEVIDVRSLTPLDEDTILASVRKTGRLVIADGAWKTCGAAAEIAARVAERSLNFLKAPIRRVTLPDAPAPTSGPLERYYYPTECDVRTAVLEVMRQEKWGIAASSPVAGTP